MKATTEYWKYRLAHEKAAHRATKKEMTLKIRGLEAQEKARAREFKRLAAWTRLFS